MSANNGWKAFLGFALRIVVAHTLTYFVSGLVWSNVFRYGAVFQLPVIRDYMLPIDQHNVLLGPFLQPVRGLIMAVGLWPLRDLLLQSKRGWLILWGLFLTLGILSTPAASPGSIEGMLYTRLPLWYHIMGYPEIVIQTLVFSVWLWWWERRATQARQGTAPVQDPLLAEWVRAIMAACFAYIGYAAGGLLLVALANSTAASTGAAAVDVEAAGANFKMQFMFIIAFVVNTIAAFWATRAWRAGRLPLWGIFLVFWLIDALVPWLYQTIVFGASFVPTAALLGLFPALIIVASIWTARRRPAVPVGR